MEKTVEEWKKILPEKVFHILWEQGTEPPFTGELVDEDRVGVYHCAGCGRMVFDSSAKFHSGSGWPSFTKPIRKDAVDTKTDMSFGMKRIEVRCSCCGGHLGHVFDDGPPPEKKRYCINSAALVFKEGKIKD
jgi:peptide-methionine (R)-S-oxide reductase